MIGLFTAFARLKRRVTALEEEVNEMAQNNADLDAAIAQVGTDEKALEARVAAHEKASADAQAALQAEIDTLKSQPGTDQTARIAALDAIRSGLASVDPDPAPAG